MSPLPILELLSSLEMTPKKMKFLLGICLRLLHRRFRRTPPGRATTEEAPGIPLHSFPFGLSACRVLRSLRRYLIDFFQNIRI